MPSRSIPLASVFERYLYLNGASAHRWIQILGAISIAVGIAAVYGQVGAWAPFIGLLALALIAIALLTLGSEAMLVMLDRSNNKYRLFNAFYGMRVGTWRALPPVNRVVVKYFSEYTVAGRRGWQVNSARQSFIVLLSVPPPNKAIIVGRFANTKEAEALLLANEIAAYLGVDTLVYDR